MAVTRTIYATIEIGCCRDGDVVYQPMPRQIIAPQTKPYFDEPLGAWEARAQAALDAKYRAMADDECRGMGTPRLCIFRLTVDDVTETGEPERLIPTSACDLYREMLREIERERRNIESNEDRIADILASPTGEEGELTPDQRREIRSLDSEIRDSNTIIREDESELRSLESQFPGIEEECS